MDEIKSAFTAMYKHFAEETLAIKDVMALMALHLANQSPEMAQLLAGQLRGLVQSERHQRTEAFERLATQMASALEQSRDLHLHSLEAIPLRRDRPALRDLLKVLNSSEPEDPK